MTRSEENHTWAYTSEGEFTHKGETNCGEHAKITKTNIAHRYSDVNDTTCNDCGYERSLAEKGSFNNDVFTKTYNAGAQGVTSSDYTVDEAIKGICVIQYKVKGANDSTYTTTAPTNA